MAIQQLWTSGNSLVMTLPVKFVLTYALRAGELVKISPGANRTISVKPLHRRVSRSVSQTRPDAQKRRETIH
jgi:antitoxin component of MazEF toxin-antitoxin module